MYLEDDIYLDIDNIYYYLEGENNLAKTKFFPSFVRYEIYNGEKYAIDIMKTQIFSVIPYCKQSEEYYYVNMSYPYQGMYLLPRKYMTEYFLGKAYNPDYNPVWPIREMCTSTILFYNVPKGFTSRNLVGVFKNNNIIIDERSLIHHLPDKYVSDNENLKKLKTVNDIIIQ